MAIEIIFYYLSAGTVINAGILIPRLARFVESQIISTLRVPALNVIQKNIMPSEVNKIEMQKF
ncbi:hypothetical protein [Bacillus sp. NTK034]|uniref:hypothetical protein n=1 Tax=Bacillaceae TaxID=186817 RepID=UPI001A8C2A6C|nr:hypothetical protein [Bacillus sp. NTK034]MBN8199299.1 hypothetical protein [Bacillus sp. NTK034]